MVNFSLSKSAPKTASAQDVFVTTEEVNTAKGDQKTFFKQMGFDGKVGKVGVVQALGEMTTVYVGVGSEATVTSGSIRKAGTAYARAIRKHHKSVISNILDHTFGLEPADVLAAFVEGMALPTYQFSAYSTSKSVRLKKVTLLGGDSGLSAALKQAQAVARSVAIARDLGNEPGGVLTATEFASRTKALTADTGLKTTIWAEKRIAREKMGGIQAVNRGSDQPPRFVIVDYTPPSKPVANVALVGKGITFDSGGLSIKSSAGMMTMKIDMAGAAAVLAAMLALPEVGAPVGVRAYLPLTDNMTGGDAQRPGDVFVARNGKTVEVLNTDAEGRLVLADALSLASESKPDAIIDIATLTGAATAALGKDYIALMGNDDGLCAQLAKASETTAELVWRLPLPDNYKSKLDSTVADVKNISSDRFGGAIIAGLFLQHFVNGVPWAHLDLGMSALSDSDKGLSVKGATGNGVRLLIELLASWE